MCIRSCSANGGFEHERPLVLKLTIVNFELAEVNFYGKKEGDGWAFALTAPTGLLAVSHRDPPDTPLLTLADRAALGSQNT